MKDHLHTLVSSTTPAHGWSIAREYLQARLLQGLQRVGAMMCLAFQGGTALRFLHAIPRYSEDLDFALELGAANYDITSWLSTIAADLRAEGYTLDVKLNTSRVVHSAFVGFPGLPHALGLSGHTQQKLAIKVEVDTKPPTGAGLATTIVRRHVLLNLHHHDRASLFAGKLHAVLQRDYAKGRDLYDLLWYLADPDWPAPNLELLANALVQSGWSGPAPTPVNWHELVAQRLRVIDWPTVRADVAPFLEDPGELDLLTESHIVSLLSRRP